MSAWTTRMILEAAMAGVSVDEYMLAQEIIRRQEIEWMKLEAEEADYEEVDDAS